MALSKYIMVEFINFQQILPVNWKFVYNKIFLIKFGSDLLPDLFVAKHIGNYWKLRQMIRTGGSQITQYYVSLDQ